MGPAMAVRSTEARHRDRNVRQHHHCLCPGALVLPVASWPVPHLDRTCSVTQVVKMPVVAHWWVQMVYDTCLEPACTMGASHICIPASRKLAVSQPPHADGCRPAESQMSTQVPSSRSATVHTTLPDEAGIP